jgi:hypothetical protein
MLERGKLLGVENSGPTIQEPMPVADENIEDDEEQYDDGYEPESCEDSCCDKDCECDDCLRCANNSLNPYDENSMTIQGTAS